MIGSILTTVGILLLAGIAVVLVLAWFGPKTFHVERSTVIRAPRETIFPYFNDLERSRAWSPFETKDPDMKRTLGAVTAGEGATYDWDGNNAIGAGRLTIIESVPHERVRVRLEMSRPMKCNNVVTYSLAPSGDGTAVTWAMDGPTAFIGNLISVFCDMGKMVGKDFEAGLAKLKSIAEK